MIGNKKIATIMLSLLAVISCSTVENNKGVSNSNTLNKDNKNQNIEDVKIRYIHTQSVTSKKNDEIIKNYRDKNYKIDYTALYNESNFKLVGTDYMYAGEEINFSDKISDEVILVKAVAKNPQLVLTKEDKKFDNYTKNIEGKIKIEEKRDDQNNVISKTITYLDQNTVYVTIKDLTTGKEKEIMLNQPIKVLPKVEAKNNVRYNELKQGYDNNRIKYDVVTRNTNGYEDGQLYNISIDEETNEETKVKVDWNSYRGKDKYDDLDDLVGVKRVEVLTSTNGIDGDIKYLNVDFGTKLSDFKDDYTKLLTNLDKTGLKYSDDLSTINGGFNTDLVQKLKKYEKSTTGRDNLEFVTEILDKENKTVGKHKISRKILKDGVVIFEKVEDAYVSFPGTTIAIADSSFITASEELEKRMLRYEPKGLDSDKDINKENDPQNLKRPHGASVIGAAIDEVALGNSNFTRTLLNDNGRIFKALVLIGKTRDFTALGGTKDESRLLSLMESRIVALGNTLPYTFEPIFYDKYKQVVEKLKKHPSKDEEFKKLSEEEQEAKYKEYYNELFNLYEGVYAITEEEKLKATDLHFKTIALETPSGGLGTGKVGNYISQIIDEDKNVKVLNMSYGSSNDPSVEEYIGLRDMTLEQLQKAVDEYNTNPTFRVAVQTWLEQEEIENDSLIKEYYPGYLGIPSMLKYFKSRDKITVDDYKQLVTVRLLTLKRQLLKSEELVASNQDILFVVSQGNSRRNSGVTQVDLFSFDEDGNKVIFLDGLHKYNANLTSIPTYLNELEKEKAYNEGKEYKYNYSYRKNILGVVGLASTTVPGWARTNDERFTDEWTISTSDSKIYSKLNYYVKGLNVRYEELQAELNKAKENPKKYPKEYIDELKVQIESIENLIKMDTDPNGRPLKMAFTRPGMAKLWAVAAEGNYSYSKALTDEEKKYNTLNPDGIYDVLYSDNIATDPFIQGSSFSAPRVTAVSGVVGSKFPFMTSHQIKQTILTTATDDMFIKTVTENNKEKKIRVGIYGVDENIGWGILNKEKAYRGPARFVRALTKENNEEDFIADIPYGSYTFSNDIEGGFDKLLYSVSRNKITELEFTILWYLKDIPFELVMSDDFETNDKTKEVAKLLKQLNIDKTRIYTEMLPKVENYINSLSYEEKELFVDAGLVKKGQGTLELTGNNTYKDPTVIEEGTILFRGSSKSPFVIHKGAKLKLDMASTEKAKQLDDEDYVASIDANVINAGSLYSYSKSDRILQKYTPLGESSKTYIAAIAKLQIDELDLSETSKFRFDVFKKQGMTIFKNDTVYDEEDTINKKAETENLETNFDETVILQINKLKKSDLHKLSLGTKQYSTTIDLVVETKDIENDSEHVSVIAKLVRKNKVERPAETAEMIDSIRTSILTKLRTSTDTNEIATLNDNLTNLDWMTSDDEELLKGKTLANSLVLGFELVDLKNNVLKEKIETKGKESKFNIFASALSNIKVAIDKEDGEKFVSTNGTILGGTYSTKYTNTGIALNYTNSILFDYTLRLKEISKPLPNNLTDEERKEEVKRRSITQLQGNVYANNFGVSLFNKVDYKNFYLTSILNIDYLDKKVQRKINDRETVSSSSTDIIANVNLETGYTFDIKDRYHITPFVETNFVSYVRGEYYENNNFGYSSETEVFNKLNATIGAKFRFDITDKFNLGLMTKYTKYVTDPTLKDKATLTSYKFENNIKGITLEDNLFTYSVDGKYKVNSNLEINFSYIGRNLKNHTLTTGIRFEF